MDQPMNMKATSSLALRQKRAASRRGMALLLVLSCLLLLATLIVALLISSQNNLKSSTLYANGSSVKTLADSTVSLVMAQIQRATSNGTTIAWASQPGMIRTYDNTGAALAYYRLFSWDTSLSGTGAYDPSTDMSSLSSTAATTWYNSPALFFDLNQPVSDATGILHFPIIDGNPTDFTTYTTPSGSLVNTYSINGITPAIEGFWVNPINSTTTGDVGPAVNSGTTTVSNHNTNAVPMPVKWLYVLQDGTIVLPTAVTGTQVTVNGATTANPIVGRIAYWTDDETSKVNINTASEGAYWDTPRTVSAFDWTSLAFNQPSENEYQRYPGHPATTCLSTVLGSVTGTVSHTGMGSSPNTATQFMPYYALAPKYNVGSTTTAVSPATDNLGSYAGTRPPVTNATSTTTAANGTGALTTKTDRLYASVDELAFESGLANGLAATLPGGTGTTATGSYTRTTSVNGVSTTIAAANTSNNQFLEKARFFLTASSRAPDVNIFNQPRIVCWPVHEKAVLNTNVTLKDETIAWCGTLNPNGLHPSIYYFQRGRNDDPTYDLPTTPSTTKVGRNRMLLSYLQNETSQAIPGFGGSFLIKYDSSSAKYTKAGGATVASSQQAAELDQILTEMFDYIRCLNLIDPNVTAPFAPAVGGQSANTKPPSPFYNGGNNGYQSVWTTNSPWGGQGQVVPIIDQTANGGYSAASYSGGTRGFGRFPTVEGATLLFICTGWNDGNHGNWTAGDPNYSKPVPSVNGVPTGDPSAWTTGTFTTTTVPANYPPGYAGYATATPVPWQAYTNPTGALLTGTLTPIPDKCVRVQAVLIVNMFDPSQGYPQERGNYHLQITGLNNFTWQTGAFEALPPGTVYPMGFPNSILSSAVGNSSYTTGVTDWVVSPNEGDNLGGKMKYLNFLWGTGPGATPTAANYGYYPFFSSTLDVPYDPNKGWSIGTNPGTINFNGGTINIYVDIGQTPQNSAGTAYSSWVANQPVQTVTLAFPSATGTLSLSGTTSGSAFPAPVMSWRAPPNYKNTPPNMNSRFPFGTRLSYGNNVGASAYAPMYTLIQPQDVTRSVRAYPGDIRIIAGRTVADGTADSNLFDDGNQSHFPEYATPSQAHNHDIWNSVAQPLFGAKWGQLVNGATYNGSSNGGGLPWTASGIGWTANTSLNISGYTGTGSTSQSLDQYCWGGNCPSNGAYIGGGTSGIQGDFDNGVALWQDGPFINKADEGDYQYQIFYAATAGPPPTAAAYSPDTPYFSEFYNQATVATAGSTFFSPNREMPSPGMFGSLPTGVIRNKPWMTLQFRPVSGRASGNR